MGMPVEPVFAQAQYRFRDSVNDPGSLNAAFDAGDTAINTIGDVDVDVLFRLRISVDQTIAAMVNATGNPTAFLLQYNHEGNGWNNVDTEGNGTAPVEGDTSANFSDGAATTELFGADNTYTFLAGLGNYDETTAQITFTDETQESTELEFALLINSSQVVDNDAIQFRLLWDPNATGTPDTVMTYTVTPECTVIEGVAAQTLTQTVRFDNATSYGTHQVDHTITQATRFDNADTYGTHDIGHTLTQSARYDNVTTFGTHQITPFAIVQTTVDAANPNSSIVAIATPGAVTSGNTLIYTYTARHTSALSVTSISDDQGNTWVKAASASQAPEANGITAEIWYVLNATAGVTTVTPVISGAPKHYWSQALQEISGVAALDTSGSNNQESGQPTVTADALSSQDTTVLIGACAQDDSTNNTEWTAVAGYLILYEVADGSTDAPGWSGYRFEIAAATESISWTREAGVASSSVIAVFRKPVADLTLTQTSRFDNVTSYGTHELGHTLTQSTRFDNATSYGTHQLDHTLAATRFDNATSYGTHTLGHTLTQSARFDNVTTFGTHQLDHTLTQSARFDNVTSYGTHQLDHTLTQSARFDNATTFGTHAMTAGAVLEQTSRFDNTTAWGSHSITQGGSPQNLEQLSRFDNITSYGTHELEHTLSQSARFDNGTSYGTHSLEHTLAGTIYSNVTTWGDHAITQDGAPQNLEQTSRFDNVTSYGTHGLGHNLEQSSRFDNATSYGTHSLGHTLNPVTVIDLPPTWGTHEIGHGLEQSSRFDNTTAWGSHTIGVAGPQTLEQVGIAEFPPVWFPGRFETGLEQTARFDNTTTWGSGARIAEAMLAYRADFSTTFFPLHEITGGFTSQDATAVRGERVGVQLPRNPIYRPDRTPRRDRYEDQRLQQFMRNVRSLPRRAEEGTILLFQNGEWVGLVPDSAVGNVLTISSDGTVRWLPVPP